MNRSVSILDHFAALSGPRRHWRMIYPLPEILLVVLCARDDTAGRVIDAGPLTATAGGVAGLHLVPDVLDDL